MITNQFRPEDVKLENIFNNNTITTLTTQIKNGFLKGRSITRLVENTFESKKLTFNKESGEWFINGNKINTREKSSIIPFWLRRFVHWIKLKFNNSYKIKFDACCKKIAKAYLVSLNLSNLNPLSISKEKNIQQIELQPAIQQNGLQQKSDQLTSNKSLISQSNPSQVDELTGVQNVNKDNQSELKLNQKLQSGASKLPVFSGTYEGKEVIIKFVYANEASILSELNDGIHTVNLLKTFTHTDFKNFCKDDLKGCVITNNHVAIVMEKLNPTNFLEDNATFEWDLESTKYDEETKINLKVRSLKSNNLELIKCMIECAESIQYIHSKNIIHGDVKAGNIGFDHNNRLKFYDYGQSRKVQEDERTGQYNLNPKHNEVIALGKLFLNMMANEHLFWPGRHYELTRNSFEYTIESLFNYLSFDNDKIKEMMKGMLDHTKAFDVNMLENVISTLKSIQDQLKNNQ